MPLFANKGSIKRLWIIDFLGLQHGTNLLSQSVKKMNCPLISHSIKPLALHSVRLMPPKASLVRWVKNVKEFLWLQILPYDVLFGRLVGSNTNWALLPLFIVPLSNIEVAWIVTSSLGTSYWRGMLDKIKYSLLLIYSSFAWKKRESFEGKANSFFFWCLQPAEL